MLDLAGHFSSFYHLWIHQDIYINVLKIKFSSNDLFQRFC